jgi:general secretion pathway protein J
VVNRAARPVAYALARPLARGVTLIELLIALAVFAVLSILGYRALDQLVRTQRDVTQTSEQWESLSRAFARFDRDTAAVLPRGAINPYGQREPAVFHAARGNTLALTRSGFAGLGGSQEAPQRVAYRVDDGRLLLWIWPHVDSAPRAEPQVATLVANVATARWRFMDGRSQWQESWPPPGSPSGSEAMLPRAVEMQLTMQNGDVLTRRAALWASSPAPAP